MKKIAILAAFAAIALLGSTAFASDGAFEDGSAAFAATKVKWAAKADKQAQVPLAASVVADPKPTCSCADGKCDCPAGACASGNCPSNMVMEVSDRRSRGTCADGSCSTGTCSNGSCTSGSCSSGSYGTSSGSSSSGSCGSGHQGILHGRVFGRVLNGFSGIFHRGGSRGGCSSCGR